MTGRDTGPVSAAWRQRHIQALARRAALHQGAVRQLLDEKLHALQAADAGDAAAAVAAPPRQPRPATPGPSTSPLAALLAHIARQNLAADESGRLAEGPEGPQGTEGAAATPRELKAVRDYRSTWSRLSVEQRVSQALARVPANAGPLNTQRLVHQALTALRDISPAYLHRLVTQVEALLWLEQVGQGGPGARGGPSAPGAQGKTRAATGKKPGAGAALARSTGSGRSSARSR